MNLVTIALKSIRQRALASTLTAISVALGVALMIAVLVTNTIIGRMFDQNSFGYDLIVGPKGSSLELVLNSIYRVSPPIENLPWRYYEELKKDRRIDTAIPLALGDSTEEGSFPILGTTLDYFDVEYQPGRKFLVKGDWPARKWESVVGANVAETNGWNLGTKFKMVHAGQDDHVHDEEFTIVGILKRTGTANDRTVFVNLNGFFAIAGHEKPVEEAIAREADFFGESEEEVRAYHAEDLKELAAHAGHDHSAGGEHEHHDHPTPDLQKEVTSILVLMRSDPERPTLSQSLALGFAAELKEGFKAQAVNPIVPVTRLMNNLVGNVRLALVFLTALIIAVSGIGIFVSIYNSMSDRKKEIAIMRALGADRTTVMSIILLESILLCLGGGILGIVIGHGFVIIGSPIMEARSGLIIDPYSFDPIELVIIPAMIIMAGLVGIVPGMTAYRTDVASNLTR